MYCPELDWTAQNRVEIVNIENGIHAWIQLHQPEEEACDLEVELQCTENVIILIMNPWNNDEKQGEHNVGSADDKHDD